MTKAEKIAIRSAASKLGWQRRHKKLSLPEMMDHAIFFGWTAHPPSVMYGELDWPSRSYWYVPGMSDPATDDGWNPEFPGCTAGLKTA